jgi:hypothetical protein
MFTSSTVNSVTLDSKVVKSPIKKKKSDATTDFGTNICLEPEMNSKLKLEYEFEDSNKCSVCNII